MLLTRSDDPSLAEAVEDLVEQKRKRPLAKGGAVATTLFAHQIGARAHATILELDRSWSVLASVSNAIYIESDAGEILWIAASSSALHPRAILLPVMPAELPTVGTECCLKDDCLHVGVNLVIRLCGAELWSPELLVRDGGSASEAARWIATAIDRAALRSPPRGLLARILFPHAPRGGRGSRNAIEQELLTAAGRAIESLCQASTGFGLLEQLQNAIALVGLGQGLTPSGDDLLGAFLYTLHVLDSAHWEIIGLDREVMDAWLCQARALTNKISFAILADHAHGDAAASLHELLNAALDGQSLEYLVRAAGRVSVIGQSSGWDMLAGVHCACAAVERMVDYDSAHGVFFSVHGVAQEMRQELEPWKEVVRVY